MVNGASGLHITDWYSERIEPLKDGRVGPPGRERVLLTDRFGLAESRAFGLEVDRSVPVCRVGARVAQPVADGDEIHAGLQQMYGRAVPQTVGVQALAGEGGACGPCAIAVLGQQIPDTKPRQRRPPDDSRRVGRLRPLPIVAASHSLVGSAQFGARADRAALCVLCPSGGHGTVPRAGDRTVGGRGFPGRGRPY